MTDLDSRLRSELQTLAGTVVVPPLPAGPDYRTLRRQPRVAGSWLIVTTAAAVVAALVLVVTVVGRGPAGVPTSGGSLATWPARGDLAGEQSLIDQAIRTWDAAPLPPRELPHRDVRLLYAGHTVAGDTVILRGRDGFGRARVAMLNSDPTSQTAFRRRLHLTADVLAPTGQSAHLLAFWTPRPTPRPTTDNLLVVLAPPGTRELQWRDRTTHWQPLDSADGATAAVIATPTPLLNVSVRAGHSGRGIRPQAQFGGWFGGRTSVWHDLDPEERPQSSVSCHEGFCSASGSGRLSVGKTGAWGDLADPQPITGREWDEFAAEAILMAESRHPSDSESYSSTFSALLPDATGLYLLSFTPNKGQTWLVLYVDRPEWDGGRAGADVHETPARALATLVPVRGSMHLVAVVADGVRFEWSADRHPWTHVEAHDHVIDTALPTDAVATAQWRVITGDGTVVQSESLRQAEPAGARH